MATTKAYPSLEERVQEVLSSYEVKRVEKGVYSMRHPEKSESYTVDANNGTCTCKAGQNGKPCKHLAAAKALMEEEIKKAAETYHEAIKILSWVAEAEEEWIFDLSERRRARVIKAVATAVVELNKALGAYMNDKLFG